ncbi:MAG: transglutaminase domain-containing protein, partial [Candidatus Cloacimonetes bacterium]|nr:transglutaminase domain-containing protein [Candidatus Cloacimonadota bacterium]
MDSFKRKACKQKACRTKLIFLFSMLFCLMFSALYADTSDNLLKTLINKAEKNLSVLPSYCKKDYTALLKKYPDLLMSFLLSYEENGRLAVVNPDIIESHYLSVKALMKEKGITKPDAFFLSYVAKLTVSDEAISDYRRFFEQPASENKTGANLLKLRQEAKSEEDLYRLAMLKTNEYLRYKPTSGRDQGPLDVATKSLYGRCEEWQILFVSICRTLGLPARAASTPWWAHQDDNHAWSEIYINGAWHYDGDYYPDQNWFTGLSNKMVIITADGSLPSEEDEVLSQDEYGAVINSIRFYAGENTRTMKIKVLDKEGKPVAKCPLSINVYNTYSLRPQTYTLCDENGEKSLSVGAGAFYLLAFKDGFNAIRYIPAGGDKEQSIQLILDKSDIPAQSVDMKYPPRQVHSKENPQEWRDANQQASNNWQAKIDHAENQIKALTNNYNPQDSLFIKLLK